MPDDKPENQTTLPGVTPVAAATGGITQVFNLGAAVSGDGTTDGKDGSDDPKPAENNAHACGGVRRGREPGSRADGRLNAGNQYGERKDFQDHPGDR